MSTERYVKVSDLEEILNNFRKEWLDLANETGQDVESMNGVNMSAVIDDFMHWIGLDSEEE